MHATINNAYPWGRSFDEYRRMFALTEAELECRVLGCADGPAAFNAGMHRAGRRAISCDPLYQFTADEIRGRIDAVCPELIAHAAKERHRFVWDTIRSPEEMGQLRMASMREFLADYVAPGAGSRYVAGALPALPFADDSFDLALCSHFLFLYSDELSLEFHRLSVLELSRVADEVRVFPLMDMKGEASKHVEAIRAELRRAGLLVAIEPVPYEFQRGGNRMLKIRR